MGSADEGMDETVRRVPLLTSTESGGLEHPCAAPPPFPRAARRHRKSSVFGIRPPKREFAFTEIRTIARVIGTPLEAWYRHAASVERRAERRAFKRSGRRWNHEARSASETSRGGASQVQRQAPALLVGERREPAAEQTTPNEESK